MILIIKFSVAAFFAAFFGKMGSDTWDALRNKIKAIDINRRKIENEEIVTHFQFTITSHGQNVDILIEVPVSEYSIIEGNIPLLESALSKIDKIAEIAPVAKISLRLNLNQKRWQTNYYIKTDGTVIVEEIKNS